MLNINAIRRTRRGVAALLAMLFLALFTTLAAAMYSVATINVQSAHNLSDAERARSSAESGLRWMAWRFMKMSRPKTTTGAIDASLANTLWPSIKTSIKNDFAAMLTPGERTMIDNGSTLTSPSVAIDNGSGRFLLTILQHPLSATDTMDQRYIRVSSTGTYDLAKRTLSMDFKIDKKVKFAIVGKVPIQIGRNTLVEGPIGMPTSAKYPPILALGDFRNLTSHLTSQIDSFETFLTAHHNGYDGRINCNNPTEYSAAVSAGFSDVNGDRYIDEYDLFLYEFDKNGDKKITQSEFTNPSTNKLYDPNLFAAIDAMGSPMFSGDVTRQGYQDGIIDNSDAYAKVSGQEFLGTTADAWNANLASSHRTIHDLMQGPVIPPDTNAQAIKFSADSADIFDLAPTNFDTSAFKNKTGPTNGATSKTSTVITNAILAASDANSGTVNEHTPYGSTSYQATYTRPVFNNIKFKNCRIPKGLNALFNNCTFEGVTYVELDTNITSGSTTTTSQTNGKTWAQLMKSGSFKNTTALTASNSWGFVRGNNLRFNDCTMNGPIASDVPTAYTHFANSWEFTGATRFDNKNDQTATIVAPQTNIEMGSFTDPATAPSTLVGVVVSGNIDIRGTSVVDGSIIVTGDGAGNTTLGWFGTSDSDTDPSAMPEGGFGRLNVRYNPYRALPDGINVAIDILPDVSTYAEGK